MLKNPGATLFHAFLSVSQTHRRAFLIGSECCSCFSFLTVTAKMGTGLPGLRRSVVFDVHLTRVQHSPTGAFFKMSLIIGPWRQLQYQLSSVWTFHCSQGKVRTAKTQESSSVCAEEQHYLSYGPLPSPPQVQM